MRRATRRRVLWASATATVSALAGCSSGEDEDSDRPTVPNEPNYRGWFDGVSNYVGTVDARNADTVTVNVGVQGNSGYFAFGPAAVAVSPGTTVSWEWTGKGGAHNVVAERGGFGSGDAVRSREPFTRGFDAPATYPYYCTPHRNLGMRGAIFVALGE